MVSMPMEENSPSPQPSPTPQCVGREFVRQYYTLLAEAPRYVHRFYSNESIFVHGSDTEEVIGQAAIQNKIKDLSFKECRTRIRGLDAHETLGKGVVVQVVGEISVNEGPMRRFVQTFVLAPQSEKKYYVHNDIFRYEDELFAEKLGQENGAPADPDAVRSVADQRPPPAMSNGSTHDEISNARYGVPQVPLQQQLPVHPVHQTTILPPQISAPGVTGVSVAMQSGGLPSGQQSADGVQYHWIDGTAGVGSIQPPAAPGSTVASQQPLPPRSQQVQQSAQVISPAGQTPTATIGTANLRPSSPSQLTQPAASVSVVEQQPPRSQSVDKASPVPSDEHDDAAEVATGGSSWASKVANKPAGRSPHQLPQQQPPPHAAPVPGTSGPPVLSPTAAIAPHSFGSLAQDRSASHQTSYQQNRQHNRPNRPTTYAGGGSQDARASPVLSGQQQSVSAGGSNRQKGPVDTFPFDQQIYVKNLPPTMSENELKEFLERLGVTDVAEIRVRPRAAPGQSFGFVAFDSAASAQKLIQQKIAPYRETEISFDAKRAANPGGTNNFSQRPYSYSGMNAGGVGVGRGGQSSRGGMGQRGGGAAHRGAGQGGPGGFNAGGGGTRQQNVRTFHSGGSRGGTHA